MPGQRGSSSNKKATSLRSSFFYLFSFHDHCQSSLVFKYNPPLKMAAHTDAPSFEIPAECWAGVVVNEGPDFHVEVQKLPVPEPGEPVSLLVA